VSAPIEHYEAGKPAEVASVIGRKLPTISAGLLAVSTVQQKGSKCLHVPHVTLDRERKAAPYLRIFRLRVWVF
jgi:hypothetical protein